jgi:hypothetical protein
MQLDPLAVLASLATAPGAELLSLPLYDLQDNESLPRDDRLRAIEQARGVLV